MVIGYLNKLCTANLLCGLDILGQKMTAKGKKKGDHLVIFDVIHSMTLDLFWGIFYLGKKYI